jgi:geranylgeranyl pyrophosphate synthase
LLIDDIEDDSELRRGKKAIHLMYGVDIAVNAGNGKPRQP